MKSKMITTIVGKIVLLVFGFSIFLVGSTHGSFSVMLVGLGLTILGFFFKTYSAYDKPLHKELIKVSESDVHFLLYSKYHYKKGDDVVGDLMKIYDRFYYLPENLKPEYQRLYASKYIYDILKNIILQYYLKLKDGTIHEYRFDEFTNMLLRNSKDGHENLFRDMLGFMSIIVVKDHLDFQGVVADETILELSDACKERLKREREGV